MVHKTGELGATLERKVSEESSGRVRNFVVGIALTAIIVVLSGYALTTTPVIPSTVPLSIGLTGVLFGWLVIRGQPVPSEQSWLSTLVAWVLVFASLLASLLAFPISLAGVLHVPVLILCAYFLSQAIRFDVFINWFSCVTSVLSIIAGIAWFLFVTLELPLIGEEITNSNGAVYSNGIVYFLFIGWDGSPIDRSMGPFWEPGVFASFLVIALIFEISYRKKPARKWVILSLLLGILVARSTAGYLLVIPVLALFLLKRRSTVMRIMSFLTSFLVVVAFTQLDTIIRSLVALDSELFGKLENEAFESSTRANISKLNLRIFSEAPWTGWSFEGANQEVLSRMSDWGVAAQTSTSTFFLAALGITGLLYTVSWFAVLFDKGISGGERIIILTCILIVVNKEPHTAILATFVILFYLLSRVQTPVALEDSSRPVIKK